ncbi:hypothetical protein CI610_02308 [invertebrate metagenome]|uniref:ASPIC/UnbV domain-containing protein n=1 Tax=invertebrate metagenome TaxID=1711999 RepID=A0A2H9T6A3_9ZZZZ
MSQGLVMKWVVLLCLLVVQKGYAHENHDHDVSSLKLPDTETALSLSSYPVFDWVVPDLLGVVATQNTADLPRTHQDQNYFATGSPGFSGCRYDSETSPYKEPATHHIRRLLEDYPHGDSLRLRPFPEIICFSHETDYYRNRSELQNKMESLIKAVKGSQSNRVLDNYVWALLYLGEFKAVKEKFGRQGKYDSYTEKSPSLQFALSQAYFRLGDYQAAHRYGLKAYQGLEDAVLDTRWHLMLVELAWQGNRYLDLPDNGIYQKSAIKKLFPHRNWKAFPFRDVTEQFGIDRWGGTGSVSFIDLDLDGWDELVWERKFMPPQVYRNVQGKQFKAISSQDLVATLGSSIIFTAGDVNNDSLPDLFRHCCNYDGPGPTQLLLNQGGLTFQDITEQSGLSHNDGSGMVVAWSDYDLDGFLDLVVADNYGPNRLYRNKGDGTFEDTTEKAGLKTDSTVGISFGDYNDDGWPDIWAQGWDVKWLYRNNKDGTFTDVTALAGLDEQLGQKGYMSFMFDYNNDGLLDLFAGQYVVSSDEKWGFGPICSCSNLLADEGYSEREWNSATTIYKNNGDGTFTNMSQSTRFIPLGMMGSNHGDWNNDGYEDLIFGTGGPYMQQAEPLLFYVNNGDDTFTNITPIEMLPLFGKGHGSAFSDFNHDGFLDLASNNGGAAPGDLWPGFLLENKGNDNAWLQIKLTPEKTNTNALGVGAKVTLYIKDTIQVKEVQSGGQFGATNSLVLHFGLAKNTVVDRIEVRWPNKTHDQTVIRNVRGNQRIEIHQSGDMNVLWNKPFFPSALARGEWRYGQGIPE